MEQLINEKDIMLTYTYVEHGKFELREKPKPEIVNSRDAIIRVTLGSICTSDLHIKHGSVPRAIPGTTVGHEMVGVVEEVGTDVTLDVYKRQIGSMHRLRNLLCNCSYNLKKYYFALLMFCFVT